jgi:hypothetical protein
MTVLIVPNGLTWLHYRFLRATAWANGERVVIDRRYRSRRSDNRTAATADRRGLPERRRPASGRWTRDDGIVLRHHG